MGLIFKVWSCNRDKKCFVLLPHTNNLIADLIIKASEKLNLNGSTIALESDGTEISDDEVLLELKSETLVILQPGEQWLPLAENSTSISNTSTASTDGSTITMTSDISLENLEGSFNEDSTHSLPTSSQTACETDKISADSNIIFLQMPQSVPISNETAEHVVSEYTWQLFDIPWSKIPQFMLTQCENGSAGKCLRKEIIHTVVNDMRNIKQDIPNKAFRDVARKMASKYPKVFLDTDEEGNVLGSGISTLVSQLQDRNWYLNRASKRDGQFIKPRIPAKKLKELNNRKAGCSASNWKPSVDSDVSESKIILNSIGADNPKFIALLEETYAAQRDFLTNTNPPAISEIRKEWPVLFTREGIFWHFQKLTQKGLPINEAKYNKIVAYGKIKKLTVFNEEDEIMLQALKILAHYFKEDLSSFYYQFNKTNPDSAEIWDHINVLEPIILQFDLNGEKIYYVAIEKQFVEANRSYPSFHESFLVCFALFFNFGIKFPKDVSTTLEMIQRYVLNDHPDSGTKSKKVSASKKKK